jgi:uncharacterized protein YbjT (DUF2867 family)
VRMSPVAVEDVADAFVRALHDDTTIGQTLELGGPEILSWADIFERIALAAGKSKFALTMPLSLMRAGATMFDWLPFYPVTRDQLTMLEEGNTAPPDALQRLIGRDAQAMTPEALGYLLRG